MLKEKGIEKIRIIEQGVTKVTIYESTLQKYLDAVLIQEGNFEPQRCVPLKEMNKIED